MERERSIFTTEHRVIHKKKKVDNNTIVFAFSYKYIFFLLWMTSLFRKEIGSTLTFNINI